MCDKQANLSHEEVQKEHKSDEKLLMWSIHFQKRDIYIETSVYYHCISEDTYCSVVSIGASGNQWMCRWKSNCWTKTKNTAAAQLINKSNYILTLDCNNHWMVYGVMKWTELWWVLKACWVVLGAFICSWNDNGVLLSAPHVQSHHTAATISPRLYFY